MKQVLSKGLFERDALALSKGLLNLKHYRCYPTLIVIPKKLKIRKYLSNNHAMIIS